jgi:deoxyribonuclease-4
MSNIKFGPSGLGGVNEAISNLEEYHKLGLRACEIAFTYGVYIKEQKDAEEIGRAAEKLGIHLSIHAPYYINLNSAEKEKIEKSKQRILDCLRAGTWLKARRVIFHPGFYGKQGKEETYDKIRDEINEIQKQRKEKKYTPELTPETTGKINVFGSLEEIQKLVEETGCSFCIDFAHILAREKDYNFEKASRLFNNQKEWHIHFSGIEYGEKGEKKHKETPESEIKKLLSNLPKNKNYIIINEAPDSVGDSVKSLKVYNKL